MTRQLRPRIFLALAFAATALLLGASSASARPGAGAPAHSSVIGGRVASIVDLPWLAFIGGEGTSGGFGFTCSGSVVAPRVVLTAGHCVEDLETISINDPSGYGVATGSANPHELGRENFIPVSRAIVYPHFNSTELIGDAGLLILSRPTTAPALPLATTTDGAPAAGSPVSVSGWGLTKSGAQRIPDFLHSGEMAVQGQADCTRKTKDYFGTYSAADQLCTLAPPKFQTSGCFGDSGGPLVAHRPDGSAVEVGIVSTGGPDCSPKLPNIFTRVDRVSAWVGRWIAAVETGAPRPAIKVLHPHPPGLRLGEAKVFVAEAIAADYGHLFRQIRDIEQMTCTRASRERVRCQTSWRQSGKDFSALVTVFYAVRHDSVRWGSRYWVKSVDSACRRSRARGERGSPCPIHTRTSPTSPLKIPAITLRSRGS